MFFFAYDGSIHGDWVSHYAVQLAAAHHDRTLRLLHLNAGPIEEAALAEKLRRIRMECERHGVQFDARLLPPSGTPLFEAICSAVPQGPDQYLVCGTPSRERRGRTLSGSASDRWLRSGHCNVLAVRVVHPGLLGAPRRLLLPIAERSGGFRSGLPFLRLFGPQLTHLHILSIATVRGRRLRHLSAEHGERLRAPGQRDCERVEREIVETLGLGARVMDAQVLLSDRVHHEILIAANRTKSRLIYMAASEMSRAERIFRADPIERILRQASCDVALYRGIA